MKIISGSSHKKFAESISEKLGTKLIKSETIEFANNNLLVKIDESIRGHNCYVIQTSTPPIHKHLFELLQIIDALRHSSAKEITVVVPYYPYVRSDKKDQPRISVSARLISDLLYSAGASRIVTMDLHSPQIQGFFRTPSDQLTAKNIICNYFLDNKKEDLIFVAPDVGATKMVSKYSEKLESPLAIINKTRLGNSDNVKSSQLIGDVDGKNCIVVDDETATASTLVSAAKFLKENGAKTVTCCIVHGILSEGSIEKINESEIDELIVTDTLPLDGKINKFTKKLTVISVVDLFVKAIKHIENGISMNDILTA